MTRNSSKRLQQVLKNRLMRHAITGQLYGYFPSPRWRRRCQRMRRISYRLVGLRSTAWSIGIAILVAAAIIWAINESWHFALSIQFDAETMPRALAGVGMVVSLGWALVGLVSPQYRFEELPSSTFHLSTSKRSSEDGNLDDRRGLGYRKVLWLVVGLHGLAATMASVILWRSNLSWSAILIGSGVSLMWSMVQAYTLCCLMLHLRCLHLYLPISSTLIVSLVFGFPLVVLAIGSTESDDEPILSWLLSTNSFNDLGHWLTGQQPTARWYHLFFATLTGAMVIAAAYRKTWAFRRRLLTSPADRFANQTKKHVQTKSDANDRLPAVLRRELLHRWLSVHRNWWMPAPFHLSPKTLITTLMFGWVLQLVTCRVHFVLTRWAHSVSYSLPKIHEMVPWHGGLAIIFGIEAYAIFLSIMGRGLSPIDSPATLAQQWGNSIRETVLRVPLHVAVTLPTIGYVLQSNRLLGLATTAELAVRTWLVIAAFRTLVLWSRCIYFGIPEGKGWMKDSALVAMIVGSMMTLAAVAWMAYVPRLPIAIAAMGAVLISIPLVECVGDRLTNPNDGR